MNQIKPLFSPDVETLLRLFSFISASLVQFLYSAHREKGPIEQSSVWGISTGALRRSRPLRLSPGTCCSPGDGFLLDVFWGPEELLVHVSSTFFIRLVDSVTRSGFSLTSDATSAAAEPEQIHLTPPRGRSKASWSKNHLGAANTSGLGVSSA